MANNIKSLVRSILGQPTLTENRKGLLHKVSRGVKYRVTPEIGKLDLALAAAESHIKPDRRWLYALYDKVNDDDEVESQMILARATLHNAPFIVTGPRNNERTDLAEYFNRAWFLSFLTHCLESEFYGHSLMELDPTSVTNTEFTRIMLFPREHVRPEYFDILPQTTDVVGIPYRNAVGQMESPYLIEVGEPFDLGRFRKVARIYIRKQYADTDWSQYSERFGTPFLMVKTTTRDKKELDAKEEMAANFGANAYGIFDDQDELQLLERKEQNGHLVFLDRLKDARQQIAKMINGQTGTSEQKAYVGAAEVHERVLNELTLARLKHVENTINDRLIPVLTQHGYPLNKCKFRFSELLKHDRQEGGSQSSGTKGDNGGPDKKSSTGGKPSSKQDAEPKPAANLGIAQLHTQLQATYQHLGCSHAHTLSYQQPTTKEINALAAQLQSAFPTPGQIHQATYQLWANKLIDALSQGAELDATLLDATNPQYTLLTQLRNNALEFAAAKTLTITAELGLKPTLTQVKAALKRHIGYLDAEYNLAVASTQQALLWQDYQSRADQYPMLRYITVKDTRVRPEHAKLHGVTLPKDHPFWRTYYPPNGYNCRCIVQEVRNVPSVEHVGEITLQEVPLAFRFNPGIEARLFGKEHPYFVETAKSNTLPDAIALTNLLDTPAQ
jgi:SPP1 gp7 family putative phage head morphogenesis protein